MMNYGFKTYVLTSEYTEGRGCAVAVGNFDGVHLGHRAMLASLKSEASRLGLPAVVFTFALADASLKPRLADKAKKRSLLAECGVDAVVLAPLEAVREMSAERFTEEILFDCLGAKSVVCGYDFRFGHNRTGDPELISRLLSPRGVSVVTHPAVYAGDTVVSSTAIRSLLALGEAERASELLGRPYSFSGTVVRGARLGRTLNTPTLNMPYPPDSAVLKYGVYAVRCRVCGRLYDGVANVGIKPTVGGENPICETFLFNFDGDCYGETAEVFFVSFIRAEKRFSSLSELSEQLGRDKDAALRLLNKG